MLSYSPAVAVIVAIIFLAHLIAPQAYDWQVNSISQLAAQGYAQAWLVRAGFISFGILVQLAGIGRIRANRPRWYREVPIMLYGLAILLSGVFSTNPFIQGAPFSETEAGLHTVFATTAGVALSAAMLLFALTDAPTSRRLIHAVALALIMLLSFLFGALPEAAGAIQRLLWVVGFAWLIYLGSATPSMVQTEGAVSSP